MFWFLNPFFLFHYQHTFHTFKMMLKGDAAMLKLMTLINVSAAKPNKRKRAFEALLTTSPKKGKGIKNGTGGVNVVRKRATMWS